MGNGYHLTVPVYARRRIGEEIMDAHLQQPSARIYEFPTRSPAVVRFRQELNLLAAREAAGTAGIASDSGWYHEVAIADAGRDLKS